MTQKPANMPQITPPTPKPEKGVHPITTTVTKMQYDFIKEKADRKGISLAKITRDALLRWASH